MFANTTRKRVSLSPHKSEKNPLQFERSPENNVTAVDQILYLSTLNENEALKAQIRSLEVRYVESVNQIERLEQLSVVERESIFNIEKQLKDILRQKNQFEEHVVLQRLHVEKVHESVVRGLREELETLKRTKLEDVKMVNPSFPPIQELVHHVPKQIMSGGAGKDNVEALTEELAATQAIVHEIQTKLQENAWELEHMAEEMSQQKDLNASLRETIESYELLLQERTFTGQFLESDLMKSSIRMKRKTSRKTVRQLSGSTTPSTLSNSPSMTDAMDTTKVMPLFLEEEVVVTAADLMLLEDENLALRDQVNALALYIQKFVDQLTSGDLVPKAQFDEDRGALTCKSVELKVENKNSSATKSSWRRRFSMGKLKAKEDSIQQRG